MKKRTFEQKLRKTLFRRFPIVMLGSLPLLSIGFAGCAHNTYVLTDDIKSVPAHTVLGEEKTKKDGFWVSDSYMKYVIDEKATDL